MWKQLAEFFQHVLFLTQETQKNQEDISRLTKEMREVKDALTLLAFEVSKLRDNEQHEREKMALRFELELLRSGRQLPANPPDKSPHES